MNYEKLYKDARQRAKHALDCDRNNLASTDVSLIYSMFPELKESEDERIRKSIIKILTKIVVDTNYKELGIDFSLKDMVAWLEKQGEKKDYYTKQELIDMGFSFTLNGDIVTPDKMMEDMKKYLAWKEKHDEQKQADTPKFKVDDWVILNGVIAKILDKQKYGFVGLDIDGKDFFCNYGHTDSMCLWTIEDAKDGDVLTNGELIVIFKQIVEPKYRQHIEAYVGLDLGGNIQITSESWSLGIDKAMPATKEQRDLLFQKIEEAGCEWDSTYKKLAIL